MRLHRAVLLVLMMLLGLALLAFMLAGAVGSWDSRSLTALVVVIVVAAIAGAVHGVHPSSFWEGPAARRRLSRNMDRVFLFLGLRAAPAVGKAWRKGGEIVAPMRRGDGS